MDTNHRIDWRGMFLETLKEMRAAGESQEMGARWLAAKADAALSAFIAPKVRPSPADHASTSPGPINCNIRIQHSGENKACPRACERCGLGPCPFWNKDGTSILLFPTALSTPSPSVSEHEGA